MFSVKNLLPSRQGKISSSDEGWSCGFSAYYNNYFSVLFWAILSFISIDCAKVIMVNYGLLSYRLIAAVYII